MTGKTEPITWKGFTLIEVIAAMVLVGVAAAMAGVGFMSFNRIGEGKNVTKNAQLAQQRMELIMAEKRKNGFPESGAGPDPCPVNGVDGCDLNVLFENDSDNGDCNTSNTFDYCTVTVTIDGQTYTIRLYKY